MAFIPFPNVPNVPGVPNIARAASGNLNVADIAGAISSGNPLAIIDSMIKPTWGIFAQDGSGRAITPDSVIAFDYRGESKIMDYPVELGGFASYNKVQMPFDIRMRMVCAGSLLELSTTTRYDLLVRLEGMKKSTDLFDVVTPDQVYENVNVVHYDYSRTSNNGMFMLIVDVGMQEVIVVGDPQYTNTRSDSSSPTESQGNVVPSVPTKDEMAATGGIN